MPKGAYTANVEWNFGPFGKLNATKEFELGASSEAPKTAPMRKIVGK